MSNSNTVPWLVAVFATAIGAGAIGFFARPMIMGETAVQPPRQQAQAPAGEPQLPPNMTAEKFGDWQLVCQKLETGTQICFATQDIVTPEGQLVMNVLAGYEAKGNKAFIVRVPLGISLDRGVTFRMPNGNPISFAFSACSQVSCDAQLEIPGDGFEKLEEAGSFELSYEIPGADAIVAKISMNGLSDAYQKIEKPEPAAAPAAPAPTTTDTPETRPSTDDTPTPSPKPATE